MYDIPSVFSYPNLEGKYPAVILCHGTGSSKDEVGGLLVKLAEFYKEESHQPFDFAGVVKACKARIFKFFGEVDDTEKVYSSLCQYDKVDSNRIGILGFSQCARAGGISRKTSSESKSCS